MATDQELKKFREEAIRQLKVPLIEYFEYIQDGDTTGRRNVAKLRINADEQRALRQLHTQAAILGQDSTLTADERAQLGELIAQDQEFMDKFIEALPTLTFDQAMTRADLYLYTILNTYNIFTVMGLPPLPMMPRDSRLECSEVFPACKCTLRVVRINRNSWDVYWDLNAAESCEDCIRLQQQWSPLKIRKGEILGTKEVSDDVIKRIKEIIIIAIQRPKSNHLESVKVSVISGETHAI